jgi:RNA polymerase sigma-70 factor, ECF subfamily
MVIRVTVAVGATHLACAAVGGRDDPASPFERHVLGELEFLMRSARVLTGHHSEAEDLVQDTLVRAYRSIGSFDGRHPRAWLATILRNTHLNRNRRRRPELMRDPDVQMETLRGMPGDDRVDACVDDALAAHLERALRALDEPFRSAVQCVDVDGLTYAEAAAVLDVPVGTVMSRLHRARARLRQSLSTAGHTPGMDA